MRARPIRIVDLKELEAAARRLRDARKPGFDRALLGLDQASEAGGSQSDLVVAILVLAPHKRRLGPEHWPRVERWAQAVESVEASAMLARHVAGPLLQRDVSAGPPMRWARSAEPLLRHLAAAAAAHAPLAPSAEEVRELLAREEDELVLDALAQALGALAEEDEPAAFDFLRRHADAPASLRRAAAARISPEHALALSTRALPPAKRAPPRRRESAPDRRKLRAAEEAVGRARREHERAVQAERAARARLAAAERALADETREG